MRHDVSLLSSAKLLNKELYKNIYFYPQIESYTLTIP